MGDDINVGDIKNSLGVAIGRNARVIVNLPPYRPTAVYNLPPPNTQFVGRLPFLQQLTENFTHPDAPATKQIITGLGGTGKTQLALAYAHTRRDQYDMLWLLRANDSPTLDNALRLLGEALGLPVLGKDAETTQALVLSHLNSSEKRWLLLYDNVDALPPRELRGYLANAA